jgi:hypothetical protein
MIYANPERVAKTDIKDLYYDYIALQSPFVQNTIEKIRTGLSKGQNVSALVNSLPKSLMLNAINATQYNPNFQYTNDNYDRAIIDKKVLQNVFGAKTDTRNTGVGSGTITSKDNYFSSYGRRVADRILNQAKSETENFDYSGETWPLSSNVVAALDVARVDAVEGKDLNWSGITNIIGQESADRPISSLFSRDQYGKATSPAKSLGDIWLGLKDLFDSNEILFQPDVVSSYTPNLAAASSNLAPAVNYALKPNTVGETVAKGGTSSVIPSITGDTYFINSSLNGPQIGVADKEQALRTFETAKNITPIVNYNTAPSVFTNASIINQDLADQAKQVQELITGSLVKNIYSGMASQTTRPEYTINNELGPDFSVFQNDIKQITPLVPITTENIEKKVAQDLAQEKKLDTRVQQEKEKQDAAAFELQNKKAAEELESQKKQAQSQLDIQAQKNAEIEAKRLADAKAAEASRLRASQQFEYDSAIEAALRAAEGNNALARRQFADNESRQRAMDAESMAQQRAKKGNPAGYAGGFAEKAIQPTVATPAAIKAPAMKAPQTPAPIEPPANAVTYSFLPPKVDGLQFGGT